MSLRYWWRLFQAARLAQRFVTKHMWVAHEALWVGLNALWVAHDS